VEKATDKVAESTKIMFESTDKLFLGNLVRYQEFLKMTVDEFKVNLDLLKVAILDDDLTTYRQLRHRMKSIIATFGMMELLKLLDDIKAKMRENSLSAKEKKEFINYAGLPHQFPHRCSFQQALPR
jgi:hypothetical protein